MNVVIKNKNAIGAGLLAFLSLLAIPVTPALATTITFDVNNVSATTWEYNYTVINDTLSSSLEEFTVFFDPGLYKNLSVATSPTGWDPLAIQPDAALPDDGFYDALALSGGIAPADAVGGFTVQFDFLGAGKPSSQRFDVVDPVTFTTRDSGITQRVSAVPLPAAAGLFLSGLSVFTGFLSRCRAEL